MRGRLPSTIARVAITNLMRTKKEVSYQFMDMVRRNYSCHEPTIDVQASCSVFTCILIMNVIICDILMDALCLNAFLTEPACKCILLNVPTK